MLSLSAVIMECSHAEVAFICGRTDKSDSGDTVSEKCAGNGGIQRSPTLTYSGLQHWTHDSSWADCNKLEAGLLSDFPRCLLSESLRQRVPSLESAHTGLIRPVSLSLSISIQASVFHLGITSDHKWPSGRSTPKMAASDDVTTTRWTVDSPTHAFKTACVPLTAGSIICFSGSSNSPPGSTEAT